MISTWIGVFLVLLIHAFAAENLLRWLAAYGDRRSDRCSCLPDRSKQRPDKLRIDPTLSER